MGIFDGAGPLDEKGSTAHLAKILKAPAVILLDVKGAARSAAATALGFLRFDRRLRVAGFILNRVGSPGHLSVVKAAVEGATGVPVCGGLFTDESFKLPERHLGLVPAWEARSSAAAALRWKDYFASLAAVVESSLDLDALLAAARSAPRPPRGGNRLFGGMPDRTAPSRRPKIGAAPKKAAAPTSVKIAYALDDAFHFYYPDNLDILRRYGAELLPFSPTADAELPPEASGIYLGGGYPELHAEELAANKGMLDSIRSAALGGMPILAECGGFMYLSRSIRTFAGGDFPMAGLLPVRILMEKKLRTLGYYDGALLTDSILGRRGEVCPGHVFHWSNAEPSEDSAVRGAAVDAEGGLAAPLFSLSKPGREPLTDGFALRNIAAS
jgi:cobyrinic acid a,c-diamide synthase